MTYHVCASVGQLQISQDGSITAKNYRNSNTIDSSFVMDHTFLYFSSRSPSSYQIYSCHSQKLYNSIVFICIVQVPIKQFLSPPYVPASPHSQFIQGVKTENNLDVAVVCVCVCVC